MKIALVTKLGAAVANVDGGSHFEYQRLFGCVYQPLSTK